MDTGPLRMSLRDPVDVLAYLPYRFGFVPTEALAVLAIVEMEPGRMLLGTAARLDLEDLADPDVLDEAMASVTHQLRLDGAAWAFTVLYADAPFGRTRSGQGLAGRVLDRWLATFPYAEPAATLLVTPARFACLECAEPPCCPDAGHPVERWQATAIAAGMVLAGEMLVGSRGELACRRDVDPARRARATAAADRTLRAWAARPPSQRQRWRERVLDAYGIALARATTGVGELAGPQSLGRMVAALQDADLRDAVVAWTLSGTRPRPGAPEVLAVLDGAMDGSLAPPGAGHVEAVRRVLTEVVRHAAPGRAGHPLAILAWLAWWCGDGARADVVLKQSLAEDPGCRLAHLLAAALGHGVRPGWARPDGRVA